MTSAVSRALMLLVGVLALAACLRIEVTPRGVEPRAAVTYIAGPGGDDSTGAVCTEGTPCSVRRGLIKMSCANNDVLELLDGTYQGLNSMLQLPSHVPGKSGTSDAARCTVRARNDGRVFLDGQDTYTPIWLTNNAYWTFEGFDIGNGDGVMYFDGSSNIIVRRVCASNARVPAVGAPWTNLHVLGSGTGGLRDSLLEDVCLFGTGRTVMNDFDEPSGSTNTFRRLWLRHEGYPVQDASGPDCPATPTLQWAYGSHGSAIWENIITVYDPEQFNLATWGTSNPSTCVVDYYPGGSHREGYNQLYRWRGIIHYGYISNPLTGAIYNAPNQTRIRPSSPWAEYKAGYLDVVDVTADARSQEVGYAFQLRCAGAASDGGANCPPPRTANRLTALQRTGGQASINDGATWGTVTNFYECFASQTATGSAIGGCPDFYTGGGSGTGARNCFEYSGSTLTTTKLWPWRMDAGGQGQYASRIKSALARARASGRGGSALAGGAGSGYEANTVTSEIASRYGAIPAGCLRTAPGTTPNPPAGLNLTQLWRSIWTPLAGIRG